MKVLYVLHRYHTNMLSTVEGWIEHGDEVDMICQLKGSIEADKYITPYYAGFSKFFLLWEWIHINIIHRNDPSARNLFFRFGIPPMRKVRRAIDAINPDLVIFRDKTVYTIMIYNYCRKKGLKCLLYTQTPLYLIEANKKNDLIHHLIDHLTPKVIITPCIGRGKKASVNTPDRAFFAPFVTKPMLAPADKTYFANGTINILEIGKYMERKNHFMMVDVFAKLISIFPDIRLTILGEVDDDYAQDYYSRLQGHVTENGLSGSVTLLKNYTREQVDDLYKSMDLFVLPSTSEPASVSILEAMSFSIPAISGTNNGTADYILPGVTGEIFEDCNADDLFNKMKTILCDREIIIKMGSAAYKRVCENFAFKNYYDAVIKAVEVLD